MSKIKELANAEAAKAEAESPDDQPAPAPEPDEPGDGEHEPEAPADEPPAGSDVSAERTMREYVAEMERHTAEWARISGVDPETLEACPTCSGAGFLDRPLKVSTHHQLCEACNGYGIVISGSLNPNAATVPCTECAGYGHIPKVAESAPIANGVTPELTIATPAPSNEPPEVAALRAQGYTVVPPISVTLT